MSAETSAKKSRTPSKASAKRDATAGGARSSARLPPPKKAKPDTPPPAQAFSASNAGKTRGRPFQPGNPGGGRPKLPEELKLAFRRAAPDALAVLEKVMRSSKARPGDRIRAAEVILNRGYGTPTQSVELTGKDGGPVETMTYDQAKVRLAELRAKQDA